MPLLEQGMIVGTIVGAVITGLAAITFNTDFFDDILSWVLLIISIGASIIIAMIVSNHAKQAHNEVTTSQKKITKLIIKLDETDKKHNEILDLLKKSNTANEELATKTVICALEYVVDMLTKLLNHVSPDNLQADDEKLIEKLLAHLESPLNQIIQVLPHTGNRLNDQKKKITANIIIMRKIIIADITARNSKTKRTAEALSTIKIKLENILGEIKNYM